MNYDFATIAIGCTLLGIYFLRPKFNDMSVMLFQVMVICVLITAVSKIGVGLLISQNDDATFIRYLYLLESMYWFSIHLSIIIYYRYILNLVKKRNFLIHENIICWIAIIIDGSFIFSTSHNHFSFYYTINRDFVPGPYFMVLNLISAMIMIATLYEAVVHRDQLSKLQKTAVIIFNIAIITTTIIESRALSVNLVSFGSILYLFVLYVSIQNPENFVVPELECFNGDALLNVCAESGNRKRVALIFRLDGYNYVCQRLGSEEARRLEKKVVSSLLKLCGSKHVFRIKEGEYVLWLPQQEERINRIVEAIREEYHDNRRIGHLTIALKPVLFGVKFPLVAGESKDLMDVISFARTMTVDYQSDVIKYINKDFIEKRRYKDQVAQAIKRNVKSNRFDVLYQPIYNIIDNKIVGAEALVRLEDDTLGKISPEDFIPIAEEIGYIIKIDEIVFTKVCQLCKNIEQRELEIRRIQVKLPNVEVFHENLADKLIGILETYHVNPKKIGFEVSETEELEYNRNLNKNLEKLDKIGCETVLDDYGSGYSNLNYLLDERLGTIRIDKEILYRASNSEKALQILDHLVKMLRKLGYKVLLEGVETKKQVDMLKEIGVDYMQGHYFSFPLSEDEFIKLVEKQQKK